MALELQKFKIRRVINDTVVYSFENKGDTIFYYKWQLWWWADLYVGKSSVLIRSTRPALSPSEAIKVAYKQYNRLGG